MKVLEGKLSGTRKWRRGRPGAGKLCISSREIEGVAGRAEDQGCPVRGRVLAAVGDEPSSSGHDDRDSAKVEVCICV